MPACCSVSNSRRNRQLCLGARARLAPEFPSRPDAFRALADPSQSPVALPPPSSRTLRSMPFPCESRPEKLAVIAISASMRLASRGETRFARSRAQCGRPRPEGAGTRAAASFHSDLEHRRFALRTGRSRELLSCGCKQMLQVALQRRVSPQSLDGSRPSAMASSPSWIASSSV